MHRINDLIGTEILSRSALKAPTGGLLEWIRVQLGRIRTQLVGGLFFATVLPAIIATSDLFPDLTNLSLRNSVLGATLAFLFAYGVFRRLTSYPGVSAGLNVIPSFLASYGVLAATFLVMRLDYSGAFLLSSLALSSAFMLGVFVTARRQKFAILEVAAFGEIAHLAQLRGLEWKLIGSPEDSRLPTPLIVDLEADIPLHWQAFIAHCALGGRPVYDARRLFEAAAGRTQVRRLGDHFFPTLSPNDVYGAIKKYLDAAVAAVALVLLLPVLLMIGIAIRLDSPGPALFRQTRTGFRGVPFTCFKFRTMREQEPGEASISAAMTQQGDVRITRLGRWLRRTRIDELPQLLNVLRGEMSWIGPRPEAKVLADWYEHQTPFYAYRHVVRPGISGWAQVQQGHVTSLEDISLKLEYDFYYIKHFSIWLDALILFKTIAIVVSGRGAR